MPTPEEQAATQMRNIEATTGRSVAQFAEEIRASGLEKHGQILAHFKQVHGLGHGNANALAHAVRAALQGGVPEAGDLLAAQYEGKKAALEPIYRALAALAQGQGSDVQRVIQKTGVSFRRNKQFALIQAPSAKRVQLGLNLDETPADPRVVVAGGMCTHKADFTAVEQVDGAVAEWIRAAYERAG